ncbi:MAG: DUF4342 domain-containing protein [Eubacteriales bacterium]|nr:DUF4342 domain-containing protein [Eubacteriales bacterium]
MENNTQTNGNEKTGLFSFLYRTRIVVSKGETTIVNLSVLFSIIALLCAPWLVVIGAIVALVLGYRFSISHNAAGFAKDFEHVVKDAASNVKHAVENVTNKKETTDEPSQPDHDKDA